MDLNNGEHFIEVLFDGCSFNFILDEKLSLLILKYQEFPFKAVYQYSLCCSADKLAPTVVFQRGNIRDCYTLIYNPELLLALNSRIELMIVNGYDEWLNNERSFATRRGITELVDLPDFGEIFIIKTYFNG